MKPGFFLRVLIFIVVLAVLIGLPFLLEGSVWHPSGRHMKGQASAAAEYQMSARFQQGG